MQKKYEAVLFDLDGTLVDSFAFHSEVTYRFLTNQGFQVDREQVKRNIGNTIEHVLNGCHIPRECQPGIIREFDAYYVTHAADLLERVVFEPSGLKLVKRLKNAGIKTGIVTNSKQALVEEIIRRNHAEALFDIASGAETDSINKESRCKDVLTALRAAADRTLYVGDTKYDVRLAGKCGMDVCILCHEFGWEKDYAALREMYHPEYMADSLAKIVELVFY